MKKARQKSIENPAIARLFDAYPETIKTRLMFLRQLIFDVASSTEGVGELEEALKWGQPGYLTTRTRSGSLIRIDQVKSLKGRYAMYFHCQTTLVDTFKEIYGDIFEFEGNRSIIFNENDAVPVEELGHCIAIALTYHLNKKRSTRHAAVKK